MSSDGFSPALSARRFQGSISPPVFNDCSDPIKLIFLEHWLKMAKFYTQNASSENLIGIRNIVNCLPEIPEYEQKQKLVVVIEKIKFIAQEAFFDLEIRQELDQVLQDLYTTFPSFVNHPTPKINQRETLISPFSFYLSEHRR